MSPEESIALCLRNHVEIFEAGKLHVADEIFAPDFHDHTPNIPDEWRHGPQGIKSQAIAFRKAFPDMSISSDDAFAVGDRVANRWTVRGTFLGELMGTPPTGKSMVLTGIEIFHLSDGKIAEGWSNYDELGMLQQLGLLPAPEEAVAEV